MIENWYRECEPTAKHAIWIFIPIVMSINIFCFKHDLFVIFLYENPFHYSCECTHSKCCIIIQFSSSITVNTGGMSRPPKSIQQAKRVAPPAVPDIYRHSGSSFGSAGYGSCEESAAASGFFLPPESVRSNNCQTENISSEQIDYANTSVQQNSSLVNNKTVNTNCTMSKSPAAGAASGASGGSGVNGNQGQFTYNANIPYQPLTHKAAVYYHQQLSLQEDQGIDLTQSPGRDSPGSSSGSAGSGSRHSTASLDSGRASSYHTGASTSSTSTRISGGGGGNSLNNANSGGCNISTGGSSSISSATGALSSPRCSSVSSCSIGSVDRMCQRTDHEIIHDWLRELCFEEYAPLFSAAGYDMPTISRMTPEDLTAIGIKKPRHRERIKQHIDALQLPDNLPHTVPVSMPIARDNFRYYSN